MMQNKHRQNLVFDDENLASLIIFSDENLALQKINFCDACFSIGNPFALLNRVTNAF